MAAASADMVDNISNTRIAAGRSSQYNFGESPESQQHRQSGKSVSSPWSQVAHRESYPTVAAAPSVEPAAAASSSSASSSSAGYEVEPKPRPNGSMGKKASGNGPSNGPGLEVAGPVIEADSWPALSASSGKTPRRFSSESGKASLDGSSPVSASQGTGIAASPSSHSQLNSHVDAQSNVNNLVPTRQKSMKRNTGNMSSPMSSNGDAPQSPGLRNKSIDSQSSNSSPRDNSQRSGSVSENHGGNEHQQPQRNYFRSRNAGTYHRGDGSHSQNYGNRRDARSNPEWNSNRGFSQSREARMQQQRGYPRYGRGPHPAAPVAFPASGPFIASPQPRHFGGLPMEMPPPVYYLPVQQPMNFLPMQPHMFYIPPPDPTLHTRIIDQVNYYFSNDNLVKDMYLRRNMDEQGWVPVALIANFKKILELTNNAQLILDAVRNSSVVEVQGDKLRRRNDWKKWLIPPANQFPDALGVRSIGDSVAASVQTLSLDERAGNSEAGKAAADVRANTSIGTSK